MTLGMAASLGTADALKVSADAAAGGSALSFLKDGDAKAGTNASSDGVQGTDLTSVLDEAAPTVGKAPAAETASAAKSAPVAKPV